MLAKLHNPKIDVRKPYTEIGGDDSFSGRAGYDEPYISSFNFKHKLGLNATTAFLTPAFRTINHALTPDVVMEGRPRRMYQDLLSVLNSVYNTEVTPDNVLKECLRLLIIARDEKKARLSSLLTELKQSSDGILPPSTEMLIDLVSQHLAMKKASRLPVLVVAAAYKAAEDRLGERVLPLHSHNAADEQTGAFGDVEIHILGDDNVVTAYEMKDRSVTDDDINVALSKIAKTEHRIDNYIFITTSEIESTTRSYASSLYIQTGGTEIAILDCIGFLRHFLHLFHRLRLEFLEAYQDLVLKEPESAVNQTLKEALLVLRRNYETASNE
jgi:DNA adenine methylase